MLEKIQGNFKNRYKNQVYGLKCNLCNEEITQNHYKICSERSDLGKDMDMNNLDDFVVYFTHIVSDKSLG